jgi:putative peptidoglycan lipid II flippase
MVFLGVPIALVVVLLHSPLVALIYERGSFNSVAAERVSKLLIWYGPALIPLSVTTMVIYLLFAKRDYRALTVLGSLLLALTAGLDAVGSALLGYEGIAIASLASASLLSVAAIVVFFGGWPWRLSRESLYRMVQLTFAAGTEGVILVAVGSIAIRFHGIALAILFVIGVFGGAMGYTIALYSTGNKDVRLALSHVLGGRSQLSSTTGVRP